MEREGMLITNVILNTAKRRETQTTQWKDSHESCHSREEGKDLLRDPCQPIALYEIQSCRYNSNEQAQWGWWDAKSQLCVRLLTIIMCSRRSSESRIENEMLLTRWFRRLLVRSELEETSNNQAVIYLVAEVLTFKLDHFRYFLVLFTSLDLQVRTSRSFSQLSPLSLPPINVNATPLPYTSFKPVICFSTLQRLATYTSSITSPIIHDHFKPYCSGSSLNGASNNPNGTPLSSNCVCILSIFTLSLLPSATIRQLCVLQRFSALQHLIMTPPACLASSSALQALTSSALQWPVVSTHFRSPKLQPESLWVWVLQQLLSMVVPAFPTLSPAPGLPTACIVASLAKAQLTS
ncbi:hypothetical protein K439DRAFT_1529218 [Ramaria rubella]|nr:hypothetical protein K439DRAFT_1529218 [Ramaria rubella]